MATGYIVFKLCVLLELGCMYIYREGTGKDEYMHFYTRTAFSSGCKGIKREHIFHGKKRQNRYLTTLVQKTITNIC